MNYTAYKYILNIYLPNMAIFKNRERQKVGKIE